MYTCAYLFSYLSSIYPLIIYLQSYKHSLTSLSVSLKRQIVLVYIGHLCLHNPQQSPFRSVVFNGLYVIYCK